MRKRSLVISLMAGVAFFCGGATVAQEPVQDINARVHPNLAAAQSYVVQANNFVITAQKENKWDMKGHAEKARQLLAQANQELKAAAEAANASGAAAAARNK
jgi:hypothetical protein